MDKKSSTNSSTNIDTTLTIDSDLNKHASGDQCSTATSFSERSPVSSPKPKKLTFYRNLVEEVRREKGEEKIRRTGTLGPRHEENLFQNAKRVYHKSKTAFVQHLQEDEAEQPENPQSFNLVINNVNQFGSTQMDERDESLIQPSVNTNEKNYGFINRVKNPTVHASNWTPKKDLEELPFRHLVFNKEFSITKKEFIQHLKKIQKGLQYAKYLIKPPEQEKIAAKAVPLEKIPKGMKTLVLDLDGTLVHLAENKSEGHVVLHMKGEGEAHALGIRFRPYLNYFLEKVSKKYEIIVFTAAQEDYASAVVDYIDPDQKYIKYLISRDRCHFTKNGFFIKDLRILSGRDLKDILIVDNITHCFCLQIENGIPIIDYQNDPNDKELKYLAKYLLKCAEAENVQDFNSQELRLRDLLNLELSSIDKKF